MRKKRKSAPSRRVRSPKFEAALTEAVREVARGLHTPLSLKKRFGARVSRALTTRSLVEAKMTPDAPFDDDEALLVPTRAGWRAARKEVAHVEG